MKGWIVAAILAGGCMVFAQEDQDKIGDSTDGDDPGDDKPRGPHLRVIK